MSCHIVVNSHAWTNQVQDDFILYAYHYYVKAYGDPVPTFNPRRNFNWELLEDEAEIPDNPHKKEDQTLSELYKFGRDLGHIKIPYYEFEGSILCGGSLKTFHYNKKNGNKRVWRHSHRSDTYWYDDHGVYYRQKMGYQKKSGQQEKTLTKKEQAKRDWRETKDFIRDRRKDRYWGRGRKTFAKTISNRWNRRSEKRAIFNEDWDNFLTLKEIHDKWMWD
jgi:hypothetical protein